MTARAVGERSLDAVTLRPARTNSELDDRSDHRDFGRFWTRRVFLQTRRITTSYVFFILRLFSRRARKVSRRANNVYECQEQIARHRSVCLPPARNNFRCFLYPRFLLFFLLSSDVCARSPENPRRLFATREISF